MGLKQSIKDLLNKFADTQPALRLPEQPLESSNPMLGDELSDALDEAAGSSSAADAAQSASDAADSADAAAQSASDAADSAALAADAAYTPTTPADWAGPAPTTIKEALDRLAAATPGA